ncbi:hypothetical protein OBBRIDRAFT_837605 [Obba rivulosa]|uniref:BTB domain-containing protein n=1 Tax=Obba rivulosa TaxID=1052685 RepID=A0A8E2AS63_9APHY|nr:hypothetical protein OBBRIDRAFT_837605 [Obba rivulosa]
MPESQSEYRPAAAPFDSGDGDIIIRSSDGVDFRVLTSVLARASPVLEEKLSIPLSEKGGELPVVGLPEDSQTLDIILRMLYPLAAPAPDNIDYVQRVLAAARNYALVGVAGRIRERLVDWDIMEREPLRVYGLACIAGFEDVARTAAKLLLRQPLGGPYSQDFQRMTGAAYHRLVEYHRECSRVALEAVGKPHGSSGLWHCVFFQDVKTRVIKHSACCLGGDSGKRKYITDYWRDIRLALSQTPHASVIAYPAYVGPVMSVACLCDACAPSIYQDMIQLMQAMQKQIEDRIAEVQLAFERGDGTQ